MEVDFARYLRCTAYIKITQDLQRQSEKHCKMTMELECILKSENEALLCVEIEKSVSTVDRPKKDAEDASRTAKELAEKRIKLSQEIHSIKEKIEQIKRERESMR